MTQEDYCSFDVSKLLKEKGFNAEISTFYSPNGELQIWCPNDKITNNGTETGWFKCIAPTHQMAMGWLRKKYNILITIIPQEIYVGVDELCYGIYRITEDLYQPLQNGHANSLVKSYENTVEAALKYTLENLI